MSQKHELLNFFKDAQEWKAIYFTVLLEHVHWTVTF
jgi:hypothetical protein